MDKDISPEERLLRLIRLKPKKTENSVKAAEKDTPGKIGENRPRPEKRAENLTQPSRILPQLKNIILINRMLFLTFTVLIVYFLADYFFLSAIETPGEVAKEVRIEELIRENPVRQPYSYYGDAISGKDIFRSLPVEEAENDSEEDDTEVEEIASNLSLMGIVSGADPQAIIQDNRLKKSHFARVGDKVGGATVEKILEDEGRVIMSYRGKEFELGI